jgi:DNA polymerase III epsilon subunit-like protein
MLPIESSQVRFSHACQTKGEFMGSNMQYANVETLTPAPEWVIRSEAERLSQLDEAMVTGEEKFRRLLLIVTAKEDGQVIVSLNEPLAPADRGPLLLDFEAYLKSTVDVGLTVWVEALGDRNSLRNLRGIEVKA